MSLYISDSPLEYNVRSVYYREFDQSLYYSKSVSHGTGKSIISSRTDSCRLFNPFLFASSSETIVGSNPTLGTHAQYFCTRSAALFFACLCFPRIRTYIERLQVNDLFMHMLVDICANNCKSRSDFLVTSRLWRSISG
jgi:hypothetical protein